MAESTIWFLSTSRSITVQTPISLSVSWGDRVSRQKTAPSVFGSIGDGVEVTVGELGHWWVASPVTVRGYVRISSGGSADLTERQHADALATYTAVATAWREALRTDPEIAAAVEQYRKILDRIERDHDEHYRQWTKDVGSIAAKFRRRRVSVDEQTVPGKCCVRSTRGNLLGYALIQDGRWTGRVEKL